MKKIFAITLSMLATLVCLGCDDSASRNVEQIEEPRPIASSEERRQWQVLPGKGPTAPKLPAAMIAWQNRVFLVYEDLIAEYETQTNTWKRDEFRLPNTVGSGVALALDTKGSMFILRGGDTTEFWRWNLLTRKLEVLPPMPKAAGVGASLAYDHDRGKLYALRGNKTKDFFRYEPKSTRWQQLRRVGGKTNVAAVGRSTGALQYSKGYLYA